MPALAESKLNLEDVAGMLKGGKRGPALVAGKADDSLLFRMAAHRVEPVMPPKDKKEQKPLTPEELGLLKLWIDAGAKDDSDDEPRRPKPIELGSLPPGVQPIVAVDLTARRHRVAAGRANVVQVYDVDSGLEIVALGGHKDIIQSLRFSPDGRRLAAGSYQVVTVWNVPIRRPRGDLRRPRRPVKAVAAPADGSGIVSGGLDKTVRFWDRAGKPLRQFEHARSGPGPGRLPDGETPRGRRIGQDRPGPEPGRRQGCAVSARWQPGTVVGVAFLGDGERVASVSADGTGRIWTLPDERARTSRPTRSVFEATRGRSARWRSVPTAGEFATAGDGGRIRLWDVERGRAPSARSPARGRGRVLALASARRGTGSSPATPTGPPGSSTDRRAGPVGPWPGTSGRSTAVAFSPDGTRWRRRAAEGAQGLGGGRRARRDRLRPTPPRGRGDPADPGRRLPASEGTLVTASADKTLKSWTFEGSWAERSRSARTPSAS